MRTEWQVWWNATLLFDLTDDDAALMVADGNPGIGFFIGAGAANDEFYFSDVTVHELPLDGADSTMAGARKSERRGGRGQLFFALLALVFVTAIAVVRAQRATRGRAPRERTRLAKRGPAGPARVV